MTIKTQQRVLLAVIGIIFVMIIGIVVRSNLVSGEYRAINLVMAGIIKEVSDINLVSGDYLLYHSDRPLTQIERRLASISRLLETLRFKDPECRGIQAGMRHELERARQLFEKVRGAHDRFHKRYNAEISEFVDPFAHQEIEDLARSFSISSLTLANSTHLLLKISDEKRVKEVMFYDRLIMGGLVISFALLSLSVFYSSRRLVSSIVTLKDGAARIASGDLSSRIELAGSDELTEVTCSINDIAEKLQKSFVAMEDEIEERKRTEESLHESEQLLRQNEENINKLNIMLEDKLQKLQEASRELESFTYSVSHDLRAPLRHLTGFVVLLEREDTGGLNEKCRHYLKVISDSAVKMGCLIDDLLSFSRMGRGEMMESRVDLKQLVQEIVAEMLKEMPPDSGIEWRIGELPVVIGDRAMLRLVLVNLISNAVKFTRHAEKPLIEVDALPPEDGCHILYVRDNGAGFDMKYVDKLFGLFQRLHSTAEYEGTGVGLANVQRIIARHGGRTWAEGELNRGATFYFTLPKEKEGEP